MNYYDQFTNSDLKVSTHIYTCLNMKNMGNYALISYNYNNNILQNSKRTKLMKKVFIKLPMSLTA